MKNDQTKKKVLALIMSMTIAAGLAGCAAESSVNKSVGDASTLSDIQPISESAQWQFPDDPKDYTVDDYRHMVSVNGITITLPTTINELKKLDEKFGYEVDYVYDGVNQVLPDGGTGYDIFITYDGKKVCLTSFSSEPDEKFIPDSEITSMIFSDEDTDNAIDLCVLNNIKIGSTSEQIQKALGKPSEPISESSCTEKYKYSFEKYNVSIVCFYNEKEANIFIIDIRENNKNG